jgi:peptidoglycan-associated lipoprotein
LLFNGVGDAERGEDMATRTHAQKIGRVAALTAAVGALAAVAGCQSAPKPRAEGSVIQAPPACGDFTVSIYFESYSATITPQAKQVIAAATRRTRSCDVTGVRVTGLADSPGTPGANLVLSKQRADAVTLALHERGIDKVAFLVAAAGDVGAQTPAGQARPLRRRAVVEFHLAPGAPGQGR